MGGFVASAMAGDLCKDENGRCCRREIGGGGSRWGCVLRESGRNFWKGAGLGRAAGIACGVLRDVMQCGKRVLQWPTTAGVPRRMGVLNVGRLTLAPEQHQKDARGFSLSLRLVPLAAGKILQKPKIVARGPAAYGTHEQMASRNRDARRCWRRDLLRVDSELVFHCSARGGRGKLPWARNMVCLTNLGTWAGMRWSVLALASALGTSLLPQPLRGCCMRGGVNQQQFGFQGAATQHQLLCKTPNRQITSYRCRHS